MKSINERLDMKSSISINGLRFAMCANTSVISESQYLAYCSRFGLRPTVTSSGDQKIYGTGGSSKAIGFVKLQIPFAGLNLIIDVDYWFSVNRARL